MERKVALITGGAKGIGRQIALSLAENGHDIAVNYHSDKNSADEICKTAKENGVNALSFYANMGNVDEIKNIHSVQLRCLFGRPPAGEGYRRG